MKSVIWMVIVVLAVSTQAAWSQNVALYEGPSASAPLSELDRLVRRKLASIGIRPQLCSDAVFVRRAYLDVIGTLPTAQEAREFIENRQANKRRLLIDRLVERPEYADYWAMKWGDILRIKAEFPVNLWPNAAQAYHHWVKTAIAENKPYDKFAREMLTSSGSNMRVGPVNFYRAIQNRTPEGIATTVALTFMGTRADAWPKEKLAGMSAFFSQIGYKPTREWKEEIVFWDPLSTSKLPKQSPIIPVSSTPPATQPVAIAAEPLVAIFPDGEKITLPPDKDPRELFADWLIHPKNKWFAKAIVNRVWSWSMGRGIIHEPDDIRDGNPPVNPELLAYLEKELIASRFDMKHLLRLIFNSQTYQFASTARTNINVAEANFGSYSLRRLDAEVLIDAINQITGTTDLYTSAIPEPFTYIPKDHPAIALADGSITSPFLALFGRSARATGMENEKINKVVSAQFLHLLNSSHIQRKLEQGPKLKAIFESGRKPEDIVTELYLTVLSRFPTPEEHKLAMDYPLGPQAAPPAPAAPAGRNAQAAARTPPKRVPPKRRDDWIDITWALINSSEFLYRH